MTTSRHEILFEAQGTQPNFRYDVIQPLLQGRVSIEGAALRTTGATDVAGMWDNPKFQNGDFDLLDANWGDLVPCIDAGWDLKLLPVFIKRKPVYNYLWVRADRGIDAPKDLEGKTIASVGYSSAISTYTRGFLQHHHGVDVSSFRWLLAAQGRLPLYERAARIDIAEGPRKSPIERLLDGDVDASTGDITDAKAWVALESSDKVRRLFPDYQEQNRRLLSEHGILTPVHVICIGGRLQREDPGIAGRLVEAFQRAEEMAMQDALSDGSGFSMTLHNREAMRDQLRDLGDAWRHGIAANRNTIETFLDYNYEQGLTKTRLSNDQVFAAGTLDT
jgi:4,5-dihydroxyphthalate decarboxylase